MGISILNLPTDIPWKQLAISEDMYATDIASPLPLKWRSSLAIFTYDPVPDPNEPANPDERTTFLKVVASVTGYQPDGAEIDSGLAGEGTYGTQVLTNYDQLTSQYYPALAALLQIAVFPHGGTWTLAQYPYLTDFEPKKREVVELVSDTGEALTQSSNDLNVRKGTTSTDSTENDNIDRGGSLGVSVQTPYGGGGVTSSHQQDVGTKSTLGSGTDHVVTTDSSREKRESFSHTTNMSQLYHVLDSYHAGTNRALFFLNARPHMVDSPYTFVKGPRQIEGIQEFFLVVRRPKDMADICVKAELETAHLHESDETVVTGTTVYEQNSISQTFTLHADGGHFSADDKAGAWTVTIPSGYHLDRSRGGGTYSINGHAPVVPSGVDYTLSYTTDSGHTDEAIPTIGTYDDHVDFAAHIYGVQNVVSPEDGNLTLTVTVYYISDAPTETPTSTTVPHLDLFLTARSVENCAIERKVVQTNPWISYETELAPAARAQLATAKGTGRDAAIAANMVSREVRNQIISSFRQTKRYAPQKIDFLHTRFAIRALQRGTLLHDRQRLEKPVHALPGLPKPLQTQLQKEAPSLTVGEALRVEPDRLMRALKLPVESVRAVYTAMLGLVGAGVEKPPAAERKAASVKDRGKKDDSPRSK